MSIDDLLKPIEGIEAFNQLPIDAEIWSQAHEHHHAHRRLHAAAHHRMGIFYGLEVFLSTTKEQTLIVAPGVGLDEDGRTLMVEERQEFPLDQKGETYVIVYFQKAYDSNSLTQVEGGEKYFRLVERAKVEVTQTPQKHKHLELARIDRTSASKPIKNAANPFDPDVDELNLMHRVLAFPCCYADGSIGDLCLLPTDNKLDWKPNRAGLWNLIQEANRTGCHIAFSGLHNLRADKAPSMPFLLYTAGASTFHPLKDAEIEGLERFITGGGTVFADDCGTDGAFAKQFTETVAKIGVKLQPIKGGSELLSSHYVFPSAPGGKRGKGTLMADLNKGVILSTFNYGGAWQGDLSEEAGRAGVRDAQEFGLNIVVWAAKRQRLTSLQNLL